MTTEQIEQQAQQFVHWYGRTNEYDRELTCWFRSWAVERDIDQADRDAILRAVFCEPVHGGPESRGREAMERAT